MYPASVQSLRFPSRWLKGYVKRYWEQESRGEMRGPEVQVDPDLEELLRELPSHEVGSLRGSCGHHCDMDQPK